jgi:hypothetical protein
MVVPGHLERLQREIAATIDGIPAEGLSWHPPGHWSAAEVLEHLYLTYTGTIKGLDRILQSGSPHVTPATWKQRTRKLVVLGFSHMPSGREAPTFSRPRGLAADQVRAGIVGKIGEMQDMITLCAEKFGAERRLLNHQALGPLTAAQWEKFHLVHGMHHVRQIRGLAESSEAVRRQKKALENDSSAHVPGQS